MKNLKVLVIAGLVLSLTSVLASDLRNAKLISCANNEMDKNPISIVKLDDPEYVTHLAIFNGDKLPLVINEEESNEESLKFEATAGSDEIETILISKRRGAYQMTLFPRNGLVIQKMTCEID